jgi:hypothetical protein
VAVVVGMTLNCLASTPLSSVGALKSDPGHPELRRSETHEGRQTETAHCITARLCKFSSAPRHWPSRCTWSRPSPGTWRRGAALTE